MSCTTLSVLKKATKIINYQKNSDNSFPIIALVFSHARNKKKLESYGITKGGLVSDLRHLKFVIIKG